MLRQSFKYITNIRYSSMGRYNHYSSYGQRYYCIKDEKIEKDMVIKSQWYLTNILVGTLLMGGFTGAIYGFYIGAKGEASSGYYVPLSSIIESGLVFSFFGVFLGLCFPITLPVYFGAKYCQDKYKRPPSSDQ